MAFPPPLQLKCLRQGLLPSQNTNLLVSRVRFSSPGVDSRSRFLPRRILFLNFWSRRQGGSLRDGLIMCSQVKILYFSSCPLRLTQERETRFDTRIHLKTLNPNPISQFLPIITLNQIGQNHLKAHSVKGGLYASGHSFPPLITHSQNHVKQRTPTQRRSGILPLYLTKSSIHHLHLPSTSSPQLLRSSQPTEHSLGDDWSLYG